MDPYAISIRCTITPHRPCIQQVYAVTMRVFDEPIDIVDGLLIAGARGLDTERVLDRVLRGQSSGSRDVLAVIVGPLGILDAPIQ
jgi:hypothetical protein